MALINLPATLEDARVKAIPSAAYYVADFISEEEEQYILDKIASAPKPRWRQLTHRRLQTWPSNLVQNTLIDAVLPSWLRGPIVPRLQSLGVFSDSPHNQPNHVLINEYPPGIGIMPHEDGSAYHPVVCTVSLGASLCLDIYKSPRDGARSLEPVSRILQEPRSLLITTDKLYTEYLHGIAPIEEDVNLSQETIANWDLLRSSADFSGGRNMRRTRISLTFRDVMKVSRLGNKLGTWQKK